MYGIYGEMINAAESALAPLKETEELLEYPEVQADKGYYLSILAKYNRLTRLKDRTEELKGALKEEAEISALLPEADEEEKGEIYREISALRRAEERFAREIADEIGCRRIGEKAYCRIRTTPNAANVCERLVNCIKTFLSARGASVGESGREYAKGGTVDEIALFAEGDDVVSVLSLLTGAHKVNFSAGSGEICIAATPAEEKVEVSEKDLKIGLFHSHGAGGQNINKVETAVRVVHIPTGVVVVCQDERSQLKNKIRAVETIKKRVSDMIESREKKRIEADLYTQFRTKSTPIAIDGENFAIFDKRLKSGGIPFSDFDNYMNTLISKCL